MEEILEMLKKNRHSSDIILKLNIIPAFSIGFILVCFFKIIQRNIILMFFPFCEYEHTGKGKYFYFVFISIIKVVGFFS